MQKNTMSKVKVLLNSSMTFYVKFYNFYEY